jgi:hypothetical protein
VLAELLVERGGSGDPPSVEPELGVPVEYQQIRAELAFQSLCRYCQDGTKLLDAGCGTGGLLR